MFFRADAKDDKDKARVVVLDPDGIATSVVSVGSRKALWPEGPEIAARLGGEGNRRRRRQQDAEGVDDPAR